MINIERLKRYRDFIATRPPEKFHMEYWCADISDGVCAGQMDEEVTLATLEAPECGMAACGGGWLSLMPEFIEAGGSHTFRGSPLYNGQDGQQAFAEYFGLPINIADAITTSSDFYGKEELSYVTKDDFLEALDEVIDSAGEIEQFLEATFSSRLIKCIVRGF